MNSTSLPRLAVTIGDPAGIGPEIILKALSHPIPRAKITVIGSLKILESTYEKLNQLQNLADPGNLKVWDIPFPGQVVTGKGNADTGAASFAYLERAVAATRQGEFDAIVTAPIAKSLWQAAGYNYPGQTEVLATGAGVSNYGMLFLGKSPYTGWVLRSLLATTHIPLAEVPRQLTPELLSNKLGLLITFLADKCGISQPTICVAGLNPHSGEQGKLGTEEQEWLIPWLRREQENYPQVTIKGPIPPDTLWVNPGQAWYQNQSQILTGDAYLALYHDQGLIPVKLLAFNEAVNTTIGLPFVRTSPDHGTAFDLAGQGKANPSSMQAAIDWAIALSSVISEK